MSPTAVFSPVGVAVPVFSMERGGRGVPGVGYGRVGAGRGYTGTPPDPPRYPYLVIFRLKGPTHGQMKEN